LKIMRLIIALLIGLCVVCANAQQPAAVADFDATNINYQVPTRDIFYFKGVSGPSGTTIVPEPQATSYQIYHQGTNSRLAILLTDANSEWLSLAHGLKSIGVPFTITQDYHEALQHKVVFIYPDLSSKDLSSQRLLALTNFLKNGGILITQNAQASDLGPVFGFKRAEAPTYNSELTFNNIAPITNDFTEPEEKTIDIGNKPGKNTIITTSYIDPTDTPLATFENGTSAITQKIYPNGGAAYAFGIDIGQLIGIGYDGREENIAKYYVNHYQPSIDVFLRTIKNIYSEAHGGVTLGTVPDGKNLAVIFTHDLCFSVGPKNALTYAKFEQQNNIKATYFVQTKYVKDYEDIAFFDNQGVKDLQQLNSMGMELGSHSVSHSLQFDAYPLGTGTEAYPTYVPYVKDLSATYNGTILGELRVSRFLLRHFFPQQAIVSFRPGYLQNAFALPQSLAATGFLYSSSVTASSSLTHLPFQLDFNRSYDLSYERKYKKVPVAETSIYEFPITLEDQSLPPLLDRLPEALDLAKKISHEGGIYVILIHPNVIADKFKFETEFVKALNNSSVWYGSINEFGDWWSARNRVEVDILNNGNSLTVSLTAPVAISGLTLNVPAGFSYSNCSGCNLAITQDGRRVVIKNSMMGQAKLLFIKA
jgi:hypothetical protein